MSAVKVCTKCQLEKPATSEHFYKNKLGKFGLQAQCKSCITGYGVSAARQVEQSKRAEYLARRMKVCGDCGIEKPATDEYFHPHSRYQFGVTKICRDCKSLRGKLDYQKNREQIREAHKQHYRANKPQYHMRSRKWVEANPDSVRALQKAYRLRDPLRYALKCRINGHRRRQRLKENGGTFTVEEIQGVLQQQDFKCYYCAEDLRIDGNPVFDVDHFVPVSRGGSNGIENLVCACDSCNSRKWAKMPWEWMPDRFKSNQSPR